VDQGPLELGEPGEDRHKQFAVRCGGVAPRIGEGAELRAGLGDGIDLAQQVQGRARQPIEG
jgi:hypothetical protein